MTKRYLFVATLLAATLFCGTDCGGSNDAPRAPGTNVDGDGRAHVGDDAIVDLAVFLRRPVTDVEISQFIDGVLSRPHDVSGYDFLPGIQSALADYDRQAVYVGFFDDSTDDQRETVKRDALASPLVDRVEEGIIPAELAFPWLPHAVGPLQSR